ncbi:polysaccharide deacetylase family protein [Catenovulum sediminis]|uniref:polysaccharide deacetylase family protein n=1 Tax=Catenovulum sediminis TaxID=1740262 RepID=UPI00117C628C|nr:polysaccharide deacetylase family protein [Catenovulum sediminis]
MRTLGKILLLVLLCTLEFTRFANADPQKSERSGLVILQYHHVADNTPAVTSIKPAEFQQHLQFLQENNFVIVNLADALEKIRQGQPLPAKAVALTFDDGYLNLEDYALPELAKRNWPATIFVNPGLLQQHEQHYLSWSQLKAWQKKGMTIANHGWLHDYWVRPAGMDLADWKKRIKQSILQTEKALKSELDHSSKLVAYPYGEYDTWLQQWLTQHNFIAFGQQSGAIAQYSDFSALPRFPASGVYADLATLKVKLMSEALPIDYTQLPSPLLATSNNPPEIQLKLNLPKAVGGLNCFVSGQPSAKVSKITENSFRVVASENLPQGRSRYNCTLQSEKAGVFYWLSQLWLNYPS